MFISTKEKDSITNNIKYLLSSLIEVNKSLLRVNDRLDKLEGKGKPAPKKRGRPPKVKTEPKRRGRPPKDKSA